MNLEPPLHVAVGVIKNSSGEILISQRNHSTHQGGLWEFPGGKVETGETVEVALARELKEELNIKVEKESPLIQIQFSYPELDVHLDVRSVEAFSGVVRACEGQPIQWVRPDRLHRFSFPAANKPIITAARLPHYYAILEGDSFDMLKTNLQLILAKGVQLVQLRAKSLPGSAVDAFLSYACPICKKNGVKLLLNSATRKSFNFQVDGVHLTSHDLISTQSRPANTTWVSASCHNLEELRHAEKIEVDFAVLAPVMPTQTHPGARVLGWDRFARLVSQVNLPVYALGGMSSNDVSASLRYGAQGVAGIRTFIDGKPFLIQDRANHLQKA